MAGKVSKALKVTAKVAAGAAVGAGVYYMGKQASFDEVKEAENPQQGQVPRPGLASDPEKVAPGQQSRDVYHEAVNERARELRARIAEQVYASAAAGAKAASDQASLTAEGQHEAVVTEAERLSADDESAAPAAASEGEAAQQEPNPYEKIQYALRTTKLFDSDGGEQAYKPTPFNMPS